MTYSIVVPHHDGAKILDYCLTTLRSSVPDDVEIVVVLNNANRDEIEIPLDETRFRAIRINQDLGYGGAVNAGVEQARGRYVIFCDNDTSFLSGWFEALTRLHHSSPRIGTASSKLIGPAHGRIVDFGIAFTEYNAPHPFMDAEWDHPLTAHSRPVQAACSAVMIIEKKLFDSVGRFSDRPHSYYNDIELCLRIADAGYESWVVADSIAFHKSSFSGSKIAAYKSPSLKADQKAWFMAHYGAKIRVDMDSYVREAFDHFRGRFKVAGEYVLVDMSSVVDRDWYCQLIREQAPVLDVYHYPSYTRDSVATALFEHLGTNVMSMRIPFIYFVDRFTALRQNALWASLRMHEFDLVVDRNGNVRRFADVVEPAGRGHDH